jgi:uncharacterized membrane protein YedE/YeeE
MDPARMLASALGGVLIGASAAALLLLLGRTAGVSGIAAGIVRAAPGDRAWRACFVAGLLAGGALLRIARPEAVQFDVVRPVPLLVVAGLLVGFGTRLGSGCTSGHGVCGVARGSRRSIVATLTFMATGMLTVLVGRFVWGAG